MACVAMNADVLDTRRFALDDISDADDSGWRERDATRIAELCEVFKSGDFGNTTLGIPSVLADADEQHGLKKSREDGRYRLNNGKSTVIALKMLMEEWSKSTCEAKEKDTEETKEKDGAAAEKEDAAAAKEKEPEVGGGATPEEGDAKPEAGDAKPEQGGLTPAAAVTTASPGGVTPAAWAVGKLLDVFRLGLRCDVIAYARDDDALVVAMNGLAHDADQNRFTPTSLATKVKIVRTAQERVAGGDWLATAAALVEMYGPSKRRTVARWIAVAREVPAEVLEHLKTARMRGVPQSFTFDNRHIIGRGEEARFKLSPEYAILAYELATDKTESGQPISAACFASEFCLPMKAVEVWEKQQIKAFGVVATSFPAFFRVMKMLRSDEGRQRVLICLKEKAPLAGAQGKSDSGGIEELRVLVAEMLRMKAGQTGGVTPSDPAGAGVSADTGGAAGGVTPSPAPADAEATAADEVGTSMMVLTGDEAPEEDPIRARAKTLASQELSHISVHSDVDAFTAAWRQRFCPEQKVIYYVDAPTSKHKVLSDTIKLVESLSSGGRCGVFIPVGRRFDLLAAVMQMVKRSFAKHACFMVQCDTGALQSARTLPTYAVYLPAPGAESQGVPTSVTVNACKAKSYESLRLRCLDRYCAMRPHEDVPEKDKPSDDQEEISKDDLEEGTLDQYLALEEDEEEAEDESGTQFLCRRSDRCFSRRPSGSCFQCDVRSRQHCGAVAPNVTFLWRVVPQGTCASTARDWGARPRQRGTFGDSGGDVLAQVGVCVLRTGAEAGGACGRQ